MKKILLVLIILCLPVNAETIVIKRGGGRRSKAILDKKFVFMQAGQEEAFTRSEESSSSSSSKPVQHQSSKSINTLSKQLKKTPARKAAPVKTAAPVTRTASHSKGNPNGHSGRGQGGGTVASKPVQQDIYNEDNWGDYAEYETVEMDESLNVNAKILNR